MDNRDRHDNRVIGVFDSGLGGLTAVRRLHEVLPHEHIVYFGDTGRVPYGTRSAETIIKYTRQDVQFLMQFDPKAIIVACNTVSAVALQQVAAETPVPMFGVVEPACLRALALTKNGRIGVIGTAATIRSQAYEAYLRKARASLMLYTAACPLFVPLVENGRFAADDKVAQIVVSEYLEPFKEAQVDTLILGCTHYPLLRDVIAQYLGKQVTLIDSGAAAVDFARQKVTRGCGSGRTEYFVSDDPDTFRAYASMFLKRMPPESASLVTL